MKFFSQRIFISRKFIAGLSTVIFCCLQQPAWAERAWNPQHVVDVNECAQCHENALDVWKATKHYQGFRDLHKSKKAKEIAIALNIKVTDIKKDGQCAQCHYTLGEKRNKIKPVAGVSCQSCHGPAKNWIDIHNDYGGPGIKRATETAVHRNERYQAMHRAGMVFPADLYGLATNCMQCHLVADADLVNNTKHPTSSDFDFVERSQGSILHSDPATASKRNKLAIAGLAAETVLSLRALATAPTGTRYGNTMATTARTNAASFRELAEQLDDPVLGQINQRLAGLAFSAGNSKLAATADQISALATRLVGVAGSVSNSKALPKISIKKPAKARPPAPSPMAKTETPKLRKQDPTDVPAEPSTEVPVAIATPRLMQNSLLASFTLTKPLTARRCSSKTPWSKGQINTTLNAHDLQTQCFGLEVQKSPGTAIELYASTKNGGIIKLFPNTCSFFGALLVDFNEKSTLFLPLDINQLPSVIVLPFQPSALYAVAATEGAKAALNAKTAGIKDICTPPETTSKNWRATLEELNKTTFNNIQWRKI